MRVSATNLDSFRLFLTQDWMKEADLLDTLRGESTPTPPMMLGTAFGRALERPERWWDEKRGEYVVYVKLGDAWEEYVFPRHLVDSQLALFNREGIFEARMSQVYAGVTVIAKADYLLGHDLQENKTTLKTFNFDKYERSIQWRFMLDMLDIPKIQYNVFCLKRDRKTDELRMDRVHTFNLFSYADMHADCVRLVRDFLVYVHAKPGLVEVLAEKEKRALKYVSEL